jgi:protein-L-isoaspartate(D-aspartate) O-methyltransferase
MVQRMVAAGHLRSPAWIAAFTAVPRHLFLSRFFRQAGDLSGWHTVADTDPGALELIYDGATWVTQLDNDPRRWQTARSQATPTPGTPTSSSTAPGLMALMLEALHIRDGHRVLEIGTGTGYNAALLCHRLGSDRVATVEVDLAVAGAARTALHAAGYTPTLAIADGAAGYADRSPYDRLIATCSASSVPPAWINQVRPGGLILTSLYRDLGGGPLALLHVGDRGGAEGRFLPDYGGFMPLRAHPPADATRLLDVALASPTPPARPTSLGADVLDSPDFGMITALRLPGVASIRFSPAGGPQRWLLAGNDGSWACLHETTQAVSQHGNRRLWDELEDLHRQWTRYGQPTRERAGLTVTASGQRRFWIDTPDRIWWQDASGPAGA